VTDRIRLNEMVFYGYHGVLPEEQKLGQRFVVDVEIAADLRKAGELDDLSATVNYAEVLDVVKAIVTGPPCLLIEAVAERVAAEILKRFPLAEAVTVTIKKPSVPISAAILGSSEIQISRSRG
jgi:dihydroneopterin aldolase